MRGPIAEALQELEAENEMLKQQLADERAKVAELESQRNAAIEAEKRDASKAFCALVEAGYPTPVETYGNNSSWAIRDLCRALSDERAKVALGLRTLEGLMADVNMDSVLSFAKPGDKLSLLVSLETVESVYASVAGMQSDNALARIRFMVARECAEIANEFTKHLPLATKEFEVARDIYDAIRAKFRVKK